jgi:uncharacterized protein YyaL (SSP411 family)
MLGCVNRLASATSPYLLQHADNPVDWQEWGEEAFAEAKRRDVPILLSVGYAACHWCHVMAHDSFEHDDVAAVLNRDFVSIKVDREERPDIDAVYMEATVALTGSGGWPMTCLLAPDGSPFFAGTFLPRAQFLDLLGAATKAWTEQRPELLNAGQQIVSALSRADEQDSASDPVPNAATLDAAADALTPQFDLVRGGLGRAPKFPPSMVLEFLLRRHERTGNQSALQLAAATGEAMARGGLYDQLAGGFARYCVDADWVVPHFEKMLYDNAQLLRFYLHWWRLTESPLAQRIARETADFLLRDLGTPEGGFASALDADTDGVEGATYVWTPAQLAAVLGPEDGSAAAQLLTVTVEGTFEHGSSVLQLHRDPADPQAWDRWRAELLRARAERPQPTRDDKVVTSWNGLAIAGLAEAAAVLDEPAYLDAATRAAELIWDRHRVDGRLRRASRDGTAGSALAVADDYGNLAEGLLMLHQAGGDPRWLTAAGTLLDEALAGFTNGSGGFFDTAADAEQLVRRPRDISDNASPSGQSALAGALLTYSALTGSLSHRSAAEDALRTVSTTGVSQPRFFGWSLAVAEALVSGPVEVAVVGEATRGPLTELAWRNRPPGGVIVVGEPDQAGIPLLAGRPLVREAPAAYVCRGMVCDAPVTGVAELTAALTGSGAG